MGDDVKTVDDVVLELDTRSRSGQVDALIPLFEQRHERPKLGIVYNASRHVTSNRS
jgi:hypothetical protein